MSILAAVTLPDTRVVPCVASGVDCGWVGARDQRSPEHLRLPTALTPPATHHFESCSAKSVQPPTPQSWRLAGRASTCSRTKTPRASSWGVRRSDCRHGSPAATCGSEDGAHAPPRRQVPKPPRSTGTHCGQNYLKVLQLCREQSCFKW